MILQKTSCKFYCNKSPFSYYVYDDKQIKEGRFLNGKKFLIFFKFCWKTNFA